VHHVFSLGVYLPCMFSLRKCCAGLLAVVVYPGLAGRFGLLQVPFRWLCLFRHHDRHACCRKPRRMVVRKAYELSEVLTDFARPLNSIRMEHLESRRGSAGSAGQWVMAPLDANKERRTYCTYPGAPVRLVTPGPADSDGKRLCACLIS
jgi:hypothetical protein